MSLNLFLGILIGLGAGLGVAFLGAHNYEKYIVKMHDELFAASDKMQSELEVLNVDYNAIVKALKHNEQAFIDLKTSSQEMIDVQQKERESYKKVTEHQKMAIQKLQKLVRLDTEMLDRYKGLTQRHADMLAGEPT